MTLDPSIIIAFVLSSHRQAKTPIGEIRKEFLESAEYYRKLSESYLYTASKLEELLK